MSTNAGLKKILTSLQQGELTLEGQFQVGSNYTFLANIQHQDYTTKVVYKPERGEQPLWDFPANTLSRREVAAFLVSQALGWQLVPPTVYRRDGPLGKGSVQVFLEHNPEYHYFSFSPDHKARLKPVVVFDTIINNADRKGGHILVDRDDHIWLIDHGVCFHVDDKLRTVIWDFAGEALPTEIINDLNHLAAKLCNPTHSLIKLLQKLLNPNEVAALIQRTTSLAESGKFPLPVKDRRQYPWPPV